MKVKRICSVDVNTFKVGDIIKIKLTNGGESGGYGYEAGRERHDLLYD